MAMGGKYQTYVFKPRTYFMQIRDNIQPTSNYITLHHIHKKFNRIWNADLKLSFHIHLIFWDYSLASTESIRLCFHTSHKPESWKQGFWMNFFPWREIWKLRFLFWYFILKVLLGYIHKPYNLLFNTCSFLVHSKILQALSLSNFRTYLSSW